MQPTLKGMKYPDFFQRYMGACRRKHLPREATLKELVKDVLKPSRRTRSSPHNLGGGYRVPDSADLPRNFIRLEPWEIEYLFALASLAESRILETGRYNGGSSFVMSCANAEVPIHSIDIAPQDDDRLRELLKQNGVGANIDLIVGDSQKGDYPAIRDIDLLFIDGDHSYAGCLADLEQWYPRVVPGGHVVLHDCYFGTQVQAAVLDFTARHQVEIVQTPYKSASHWRFPTGSLAHFRKTHAER